VALATLLRGFEVRTEEVAGEQPEACAAIIEDFLGSVPA